MRTTSRTVRYTLRGVAAVLFALGALSLAATGAGATHTGSDGPEVTPEFIAHADDRNPTCVEYEGTGQDWIEVKHDAPPANTTKSDSNVSIEISHATSTSFSWELKSGHDKVGGIDAVLVKSGAQGHNLYRYDPAVGEQVEDDGLISPDQQQGISHISFCYDVGGGPTTTEEETTTTTEEETTTTVEEETTTTVEETTTTEGTETTQATVQSTVTERETEVAGVQVTQPAPAPAVESAQLARTGLTDWLAPLGVALIALGVAALRMSRTPRPARVIAR